MTGKNRRHYHCKALNSLLCADVPLRNYSLTHSRDKASSQGCPVLEQKSRWQGTALVRSVYSHHCSYLLTNIRVFAIRLLCNLPHLFFIMFNYASRSAAYGVLYHCADVRVIQSVTRYKLRNVCSLFVVIFDRIAFKFIHLLHSSLLQYCRVVSGQ